MNNKTQQSFLNLKKALDALAVATPATEDRDYAGIVQSFEFTYELTWKTLKRILEGNGIDAPFPRVVFEESFKRDLLDGNEIWKDIIEARNRTPHSYDHKLAVEICAQINDKFLIVFQKTFSRVEKYMQANQH